jgi:hypothetical protein
MWETRKIKRQDPNSDYRRIYLFICALFNDAVNNSDYELERRKVKFVAWF